MGEPGLFVDPHQCAGNLLALLDIIFVKAVFGGTVRDKDFFSVLELHLDGLIWLTGNDLRYGAYESEVSGGKASAQDRLMRVAVQRLRLAEEG